MRDLVRNLGAWAVYLLLLLGRYLTLAAGLVVGLHLDLSWYGAPVVALVVGVPYELWVRWMLTPRAPKPGPVIHRPPANDEVEP